MPEACAWSKGPYPGVLLLYMQVDISIPIDYALPFSVKVSMLPIPSVCCCVLV